MRLVHLAMLGMVFAAVPAAIRAQAQPQAQPQAAAPASSADPNEVVCEREEVVGSRLAHRRVCMTRSQWEQARREDRNAVEKVQTDRGMISEPMGK